MAQKKNKNQFEYPDSYALLENYLKWFMVPERHIDKTNVAVICKMLNKLSEILNNSEMDADETYMCVEIHCAISGYLELLDLASQKIYINNCNNMLCRGDSDELAIQLEASRIGYKDIVLKKQIIEMLCNTGVYCKVLDYFFDEQVVCTTAGQNVMAYLDRAVCYLKTIPETNPEVMYLLNQALIAVEEAFWGFGIKENDLGYEHILYVRDRVRQYLDSGYG